MTKKGNTHHRTDPHVSTQPFNRLLMRCFCYATEDEAKVKEGLVNVSGIDEPRVIRSTGHHGNLLLIMEAEVVRNRDIIAFFSRLSAEDLASLYSMMEKRLDDQNGFHLRIDKQKAYQGEVILTTGKDVINVSGKVASYPKSREGALEALSAFLDGVRETSNV